MNQMQQNFNTLVKQLRERVPEGNSLLAVEKNMEQVPLLPPPPATPTAHALH